ncbi:hypothetical protein [Amycolatopsis australiensis]|nr:hypothetical protein [Amycolatopsis australiensis]
MPDLLVTDEPGLKGVSLTEKQVVLVAEIVSPSTMVCRTGSSNGPATPKP